MSFFEKKSLLKKEKIFNYYLWYFFIATRKERGEFIKGVCLSDECDDGDNILFDRWRPNK